MLLHENIPALRVVIILLLVIPQAETRQGRRCLVPEKYGHEGRKGVPRGEFAQPAYTDIDQDPGQIRERARGRVHRRVLRRILAAGVQQVGAMEKSTWHGGTYIYTHTHIYTFCSMPIDSKPITYSTFSSFSFDLDLLTFRISFFLSRIFETEIRMEFFVRVRFGTESFLSIRAISEDGIFFYFNFDFVLPTLLSGSVTPKYFKL